MVEVAGTYTVAFRGSRHPSTNQGVYYWDTMPTGPFRAFEEGDLIPSVETTSTFSGTITAIEPGAPPAISANGHLAQIVTLSNPSQGYPPVGSPGQGVVRHVMATGAEWVACNSAQPVNGATYLLNAISRPVSIDSVGTVGVRCTTSPAGSGIFREAATGIDKVVATGDSAPGISPAGTFSVVGGNNVNAREQQWNSANQPAFFATTSASGTGAIGATGIWADSGSGVVDVALSGQTAWTLGVPWGLLESPSINNDGDIAFRACLTTSACGDEGVWARFGVVESLIVLTGQNAPSPTGSSTNELFVDFGIPVIDGEGRIAFWATTNSPGNPQGIWIADGTGATGIRRIARKDDVVRGTSTTFDTFGKDLAIADTGQVAFTATHADTTKGLFVESEYHTLIKLARTTELFPLPNGTSPGITNIIFYPSSPSQGVGGLCGDPNSLPDSVAVAFQLAFPNGHSAVVLTAVGP